MNQRIVATEDTRTPREREADWADKKFREYVAIVSEGREAFIAARLEGYDALVAERHAREDRKAREQAEAFEKLRARLLTD